MRPTGRFRRCAGFRFWLGMMVEIVQLTARKGDVLRNVADIFDAPIDFDLVRAYVAEANHLMFVAIEDGLVIGQVLGVIHRHPDKPTELYIDDLCVDETWQRKGIATRLMQALIDAAKALGAVEIWVGTEPDNEEAILFYRSLGLEMRTATIFEGAL